ncbi:MAG: chromosome segregation protein SMC [Planctomycetaceae bacterium]|nr:chromosome segregation protein SMC [Planctomycetaceae bacterium]
MRLKSVELFGFKSFADHTVITFDDGITGILGPNGCGKSNVVDAIKWVLGEKSAKNLRGEEMLDVIFSGCATRPPSGMAEVKLIFDNADQAIPLPYAEVCIGRRLYRSKESHYFINQTRCRQKEIRDLLLDSGIGTSGYTVIEQGRVEALLHAKPAERRTVFEEAAGIAKFKIRRKEILSRLDRTEQILLRVNDRVEEKERQIRKVAAQAANARRHRRLSEERDAMRTHLYTRKFAAENDQLRLLAKQREDLEQELDREEKGLAALNAEFTRLAEHDATLSRDRDEVVEAAAATQEELSAVQLGQMDAKNRIETLTAEITRGNERRNDLLARLERLTAQEAETRAQLAFARERAEALEAKFSEQSESRQALLDEAAAAETAVTRLRNETIDANRLRQELAADVVRIEAAEQSSASRIALVDGQIAHLREEEETVRQALVQVEGEYNEAAASFGENARRLDDIRGQAKSLSAQADDLLREERARESERSAKASRKATLEDLEASFDGAFEGVRNILTAQRDGRAECRGVVGMALDLMTVPQDVAVAVETILGGQAQDVVVDSARDAQSCIEYLKRNRLGRATFLPIDRIQPRRRLVQNLRHIPGVIGEAVDLVSYDRRYNAVMEYLLAGTLVVDSLDLARELSAREARGIRIVTLEGDVVNPSGAMTGGHGRQRRAGLVQRKAELDALVDDLADCERRLDDVVRRRQDIVRQSESLTREAAELERRLAEAGRSEEGLKQNLASRRADAEGVARNIADLKSERESLHAGGRQGELEDKRRLLLECEENLARLEQEVAARTEDQRRTRERIDTLGHEFATLSGERSGAIAKAAELESRLGEFVSGLASTREELDRPGLSATEAEASIAAARERLDELNSREADLLRVREERRATAAELSDKLTECRQHLDELRQRERDSQAQAARIREGLGHIDRQQTECRMRIENVREKAREELNLELDDIDIDIVADGDDANADGGLAAPEAKPATEQPDYEWLDWPNDQLEARIDDVNQKIRNIGGVNPGAIEELAELEAAAEFLRSHKEEHEEASAGMKEAIDRLNEESSTRFTETFRAVRENFQLMFTRLFGGGKADLVLEEVTEEGADPLDAGIEIKAQPPGKEPKSISLLSGGEKALCAVALLFALFRSKPSPFCILDEVDGPLDESNIDRFMQLVRDFTGDTQFIIITHAQRSMSKMDSIWGVTQPAQGISSVLGLKYEKMEEMSREQVRPEGKESIPLREIPATA